MPAPQLPNTTQDLRKVVRKARQIMAMLQGTMGLEGQGLDRKILRDMKKRTISDLLAMSR